MSDKDQHFNLVDHNYEALSHLSNPDAAYYTDWCTTIIFYMALHNIHAYLAEKENIHPSSHTNLDRIISKNANLRRIYDKYRHLKDDSQDARYEGKILTVYQMRQSVLRFYSDIENEILHLLKLKARPPYDLYPLFPLN